MQDIFRHPWTTAILRSWCVGTEESVAQQQRKSRGLCSLWQSFLFPLSAHTCQTKHKIPRNSWKFPNKNELIFSAHVSSKDFLPQVCIALHCRLGICSNFGWFWQISDGETSRLAQVRDGPYICGAYCFMFSNEDICKDTYQILGGWVGAVTILMWQY